MGYLIFIGHFPRKSPIISGFFAKSDLQLKASNESRHPVVATELQALHKHTQKLTRTPRHTHTHTHTHMHTHAHAHTHTHTHTHARMHTFAHAHIYTRTHPQTHTRTHAHTHIAGAPAGGNARKGC